MMTLFIMSTTEGWIPIMWSGVDATDIDKQPTEKNQIWWVFFFIAFIIVGSLFILNLFVGVVINMFSSEKDKLSKNHLLTRQQQEWVQIQLMHFKAKPIKKVRYTGNNLIKRLCINITLNPWFDSIIMVFIILNTIVLGLKWYGEPNTLPSILEIINYFFAGVFTVEAFIKLIALGKGYF